MFARDTTIILAFQRVAGDAHELGALNAEFRKIQACLSATEDDDVLVAERKVSIQVYPAGLCLIALSDCRRAGGAHAGMGGIQGFPVRASCSV
jgi:hypothetical protein